MADGSWLSDAFGDLFGGLEGVWRRDATFVYWHNDLTIDMTLCVPRDDLERFLADVESDKYPGIFMLLFD